MTPPPLSNLKSEIPDPDPDTTGLPLFPTWPAVYAFILISFALMVLALFLFTRTFS
jgi:hypothetical protein